MIRLKNMTPPQYNVVIACVSYLLFANIYSICCYSSRKQMCDLSETYLSDVFIRFHGVENIFSSSMGTNWHVTMVSRDQNTFHGSNWSIRLQQSIEWMEEIQCITQCYDCKKKIHFQEEINSIPIYMPPFLALLRVASPPYQLTVLWVQVGKAKCNR